MAITITKRPHRIVPAFNDIEFEFSGSNVKSTSQSFPVVVTNSMTAKRIRGTKNLEKDSYEAQTSSSYPANNVPTDDWYWNVWVFNNDGTGPVVGKYRIFIDYFIEFYERKEAPLTFHNAETDVPAGHTGPVLINHGDDNSTYLLQNGGDASHLETAFYNGIVAMENDT